MAGAVLAYAPAYVFCQNALERLVLVQDSLAVNVFLAVNVCLVLAQDSWQAMSVWQSMSVDALLDPEDDKCRLVRIELMQHLNLPSTVVTALHIKILFACAVFIRSLKQHSPGCTSSQLTIFQ